MNNSETDELLKLLDMVDKFSYEMKEELILKSRQGKTGWEEAMSFEDCIEKIEDKLDKAENEDPKSLIAIANYTMMAYHKSKQDKG